MDNFDTPNWATAPEVLAVDKFRGGQSLWPTRAQLDGVPGLYKTEDTKAAGKLVVAHWFVGSADWWAVEIEHVQEGGDYWDGGLCFGFACLTGSRFDAEWGYFHLAELALMRVPAQVAFPIPGTERVVYEPFTMAVERDEDWEPRKACDVSKIREYGGV